MSQVRQNFHEDCEASINKQINLELQSSYVFLSMSYHFDRDDVALPGLSKFFKKASEVEYSHAQTFMKYQNERGGSILLQSVAAPTQQQWGCVVELLQVALDLKKQVTQGLLDLHMIASAKSDGHTTHFVDDNFLMEHVESIKKLGDMITKLKRAGTSDLGLHMFDQECH